MFPDAEALNAGETQFLCSPCRHSFVTLCFIGLGFQNSCCSSPTKLVCKLEAAKIRNISPNATPLGHPADVDGATCVARDGCFGTSGSYARGFGGIRNRG